MPVAVLRLARGSDRSPRIEGLPNLAQLIEDACARLSLAVSTRSRRTSSCGFFMPTSAGKGVLKHYDHSKRIADRLDWLTRWESKVRDIVGLPAVQVEGGAVLYLYRTTNGLPELRATREVNRGREYVGAFPSSEAVRKAEEIVARMRTGTSL